MRKNKLKIERLLRAYEVEWLRKSITRESSRAALRIESALHTMEAYGLCSKATRRWDRAGCPLDDEEGA